MSQNPYEAPLHVGVIDERTPSPLRASAQRALRLATLLLFFAAAYNYWEFDLAIMDQLADELARVYRAINCGWFVVVGLAIWFFGLWILELIARALRAIFAPAKNREAWLNCLYQSLDKAPLLAGIGMLLWLIWTYAFYKLGANFYVISWLVGIPAHLTAAAWYVPLIRRWWRLA